MKLRSIAALPFLYFALAFSCNAQNGPTQPSVVLTWTQSVSAGVTRNCVYRGAASGGYSLPAIFCSPAPIITYTDTTVVRGQSYHYAVTAGIDGTEGAYSNDVIAAIPLAPAAPSNAIPKTITQLEKDGWRLEAQVREGK